jgi:hypothetical protein
MITKTVNLYTFDELSDTAKECARQWWRELESEEFGQHADDSLYEPITTAAKILGITFKTHDVRLMSGKTRAESDIFWTLHTQGAGASFNGTYAYARGCVKAIKTEFGTDETLHAIARDLAALERQHGYGITATIEANARCHSITSYLFGRHNAQALDDLAGEFDEVFRTFADWMYRTIDADYDARMADDYVDDAIRANEYTFTVDGKRDNA